MTSDQAGKRVEFLREVVPALPRLAILANIGNPNAVLEMGEVQTAARTLGLEAATFEIRRSEDIAPSFEALKGRTQAIYIVTDPLTNANRLLINNLSLGARLPTMYNGWEIVVETGGLMSYGPNIPDLYRRAAEFVDRFCAGRSRETFPLSSQPNSNSSTI